MIGNTRQDIAALIDSFKRSGNRILVVMEATGGYESLLAEILFEHKIDCVIANPKQVRDFTGGMGKLAKTDRIDAQALALFGKIVKPDLAEKTNENEQKLKALVHRRDQVIRQLTQEKNRLDQTRNLDTQQSIEQAIDFYKQQKKELDKKIKQASAQCKHFQVKAEILQSCKGVGPVTTTVLLCELPELGQLNRAEVAKLAGVAPIANDSGNKKGYEESTVDDGWCAVPFTWQRWWPCDAMTPSKLQPFTLESLTARRAERQCRSALRAVSGSQSESPLIIQAKTNRLATCRERLLKTYYQHLRAKGKPAKVAMVACMRKLLTILNFMVKNNQKWDENKLAN